MDFETLVNSDASIARDILAWVVPEEDPDALAYAQAKTFAGLVLRSTNY